MGPAFHYMKFKIGDTLLNDSEAKALLSAASEQTEIIIDISKHVDPRMFDPTKLFSMSVETRNPTLANLAMRFAVEGVSPKRKRPYNRTNINRISQITPTRTFDKPEEVIELLCGMNSLKALGAATILEGVKDGYKRPLRNIAVKSVNRLAYLGLVSADSQCFQGFYKNAEGEYQPLVQGPEVPRTASYHSSPMYVAMRDGAQLLKEWGLIEVSESTEFGSDDKDISENAGRLRRIVYKVSPTAIGQKVAHQWGDINDFIGSRWSTRIRGKQSSF